MVESVFQTLLLLAYFDIALISITIANYAVSASFLGRESRLSRRRMEKRKKQLDEKVKELQKKGLPIEELNKETNEAQVDIKNIGWRIFLLSWLGAVIFPIIFFVFSFTCSVIGMNAEILWQDLETQRLEQVFTIVSSGTLAMGFAVLLFVIKAIDSAAKKVPIPEFQVYFQNRESPLKLKRKETVEITPCIENIGEDVAEDVLIMVHFPPSFKLKQGKYHTCKQGSESDFPDHDSAFFPEKCIHPEIILNIATIKIETPDEKGIYTIPVSIHERKVGTLDYKLTIEVVD
jgi:hypothetical protein